MKGKITFVLGAAVGYVLGTRAGRERYEQIKKGAQRVWETPPVQRGVQAVRGAAQERLDRAKDAAFEAGRNLISRSFQPARPATQPAPKPTAQPASAQPAATTPAVQPGGDPA